DQGDQRIAGFFDDAASFVDVIAVEADDERLRRFRSEDLERFHDAVCDRVAGGDTAEDVHEYALDLFIVQDDVEPVGHDGGRSPATDIQEVGGFHAAVLL